MTTRRAFFTGLGAALIAAPAIVRVTSLMTMPRAPLEMYRASPAMNALPDIATWQRLMHGYIESVIRPPLAIGGDGRIGCLIPLRDHDRATYDALMACKPAGT